MIKCRVVLAALISMVLPTLAIACPTIHDFVDFNCDQKIKIVFLGDSFVTGEGDSANQNSGGYVLRLINYYARQGYSADLVSVVGFGYPGKNSDAIASRVRDQFNLNSNGPMVNELLSADYIILDYGRNDYFIPAKPPPLATARNLKRMITYLRKQALDAGRIEPLVLASTLLTTNRKFQNPFISLLNKELVAHSDSSLPVLVNFDQLNGLSLRADGLHPTSNSYTKITKYLISLIAGKINRYAAQRRGDTDGDGVSDAAERKRFFTNRRNRDTDGDGVPDGTELFTNQTDPNNPASF